MELLENVQIENLANLIEQLTILELGKQERNEIKELNLANLYFIGIMKDFVLNNKLMNLDSHFMRMNDVEFVYK